MVYVKPSRREDFEIVIICGLPLEFNAVSLLLDEYWDEDGDHFGRSPGDVNHYITGRIGRYNVVLALLSHIGKVHTASAAASIRSSYGSVRLALLVGICGGAPQAANGEEDEILLGDVIISRTVIQYDFGRLYPDRFIRKDTLEDNLGKANKDIRNLLITFETDIGLERLQRRTAYFLKQLQANATGRKRQGRYSYPGTAEDKLFKSLYRHKHHVPCTCVCRDCNSISNPVCDEALSLSCEELGCDNLYLEHRGQLDAKRQLEQDKSDKAQEPTIHMGSIASGDIVMKSAEDRDRIAKKEGVIAFEMEGAGIWEELPCIVIKGICDYADCHKNKRWQNFAAATAASTLKAVLERYIQTDKNRNEDLDPLERDSITQGASWYDSEVRGEDVTQGNELRVSSPQSSRHCIVQEGSYFGGVIKVAGSVVQGNRMSI
ncbi:phosphorylase superfamily protein [Trichoderma gamsii]|uniref:Phosphorylase superfamily protein n=1 Tax=Trichoderma gamsii TaxID=398673 RepID=A0A2P4ZHM5_9HYPO|nr:phosphorylase superfamily protein [Trichoderma gamsii]PON23788.1 phosphorylase superfamily protein [Trichoderma gamsii]